MCDSPWCVNFSNEKPIIRVCICLPESVVTKNKKKNGVEIVVNMSRNKLKWIPLSLIITTNGTKMLGNNDKWKKREKSEQKKRNISKTIIRERERFDEAFYLNPVCNQRLFNDYIEVERLWA